MSRQYSSTQFCSIWTVPEPAQWQSSPFFFGPETQYSIPVWELTYFPTTQLARVSIMPLQAVRQAHHKRPIDRS
jgi:hypothetical protein